MLNIRWCDIFVSYFFKFLEVTSNKNEEEHSNISETGF
jgi:hypothetical protein